MTSHVDTKKKTAPVPKPAFGTTNKSESEIVDTLIRARVNMLINMAFFGTLATKLKFIDATLWCPTAGTDGRNFYYNRDFVAALSEGERIFLAGHEVMHCVYDHIDKDNLRGRIPKLLNIAQDYRINLDLVQARCGEKIKLVDICYDTRFGSMSSDEIYDILYEEAKQDGRILEMESLDMHLGDLGDLPSDPTGKTGPIPYSEEEKQQIADSMQGDIIQAYQAAGGADAGDVPGGVKRLMEKLLNPQIDWRTLLAMMIQSVLRSNYTWQRPSRKGMDSGMYLPSMDREQTIDIAIGIDTSGSISEQMMVEFLSEVHGIMTQYTDFTITMWCFDTSVHNKQVFTAENMDEFMEYEPAGGGGTDFMCNWEFMKENDILPKKFIMFTDMCPFGSWGDEEYVDTLFISNNARGIEAPFGMTVPYNAEA